MKINRNYLISALSLAVFLAGLPAAVAAVSGSVGFEGTAPEKQKINMAADPTCARMHSEPMYTEDVIVNDNGTLKNVFVYVKSGLEGQNFKAPKEAVTLDQNGCHYVPHVLGVQVGQPVEIKNSDATLHNVHSLAKNSKEFNLGMPIKGMKLKKKFTEEEVMVKVKCDVHPWMNAYIGVLEHPYFSVTGEDGSFSIEGLPAGTYTLEAWHEKYGTQTAEVTVDASGTASADFTFSG